MKHIAEEVSAKGGDLGVEGAAMLALRAPRALLRCSSSCRTRLAPTVGRSYCTGPRKPSGFGHFFPRTGSSSSSSSGASRVPKDAASKDASKAEKGADKMKAEGGSGGGGSSEGGGGGGGFKMPDNDQLVRIGLAAAGATVLTYAITGGEGGGGGRSHCGGSTGIHAASEVH